MLSYTIREKPWCFAHSCKRRAENDYWKATTTFIKNDTINDARHLQFSVGQEGGSESTVQALKKMFE